MCAAVCSAPTEWVTASPPVKPNVGDDIPESPTRTRFTVSYANRPSTLASTDDLTNAREDMAFQKAAVMMHRQAETAALVASHEKASVTSESDRRISTIMLLNVAAKRDIHIARREGYPAPVVDFMAQTWNAFLRQATEFYRADAAQPYPTELSRTGLENISSIGVWFNGPHISLPLRRYTVQVMDADGALQNITAVGLLSFAYSSYVMQLRALSQQATLENLAMMQEQLGTSSLFLPQLLVAPS